MHAFSAHRAISCKSFCCNWSSSIDDIIFWLTTMFSQILYHCCPMWSRVYTAMKCQLIICKLEHYYDFFFMFPSISTFLEIVLTIFGIQFGKPLKHYNSLLETKDELNVIKLELQWLMFSSWCYGTYQSGKTNVGFFNMLILRCSKVSTTHRNNHIKVLKSSQLIPAMCKFLTEKLFWSRDVDPCPLHPSL